jgi:hypothetical protein
MSSCEVGSRLVGLAAHDHDALQAPPPGMQPHHIHVGWIVVLVLLVVGVVGSRAEADVVGREVSLELQVVINDLFKNVFLH